ncbi:MAG: hypothetical protein IPN08_00040 [Bacteroidales bacterium]|nr:hypothetical protein [Bacteroidales bacterium]
MKIHSFNIDNIGLYYISPYIEYRTDEEFAYFYHSLFDKSEIFGIKDSARMQVFFETMNNGTDEQHCLSMISNAFKADNPANVLMKLMQSGIVE